MVVSRAGVRVAPSTRHTDGRPPPARSIATATKELAAMGGPVAETRGARVHLLLRLCRDVEDAFRAAVDGGKDGVGKIML